MFPCILKSQNVKSFCSAVLLLLILAFFSSVNSLSAQSSLFVNSPTADTTSTNLGVKFFMSNPSSWIQNSINKLNSLTLPYTSQLDTSAIRRKLNSVKFSVELVGQDLDHNAGSIRLRYLNEINNELLTNINELARLQNKLEKYNNYLTNQTLSLIQIKSEIDYFNKNADPSIKTIYKDEIQSLSATIAKTENYFRGRLMRQVKLEDAINSLILNLQENSKNDQLLIFRKEVEEYTKNFPAIWETSPSDYSQPLGKTIVDTAQQNMDSIRFFIKHNSFSAIFFRLSVFLLFLIPLLYFKKNNKIDFRTSKAEKYIHKYPNQASIVLGLTVAPIIFNHSPLIILDFIFIFLTIMVSIIFIKEHENINRKFFYFMLAFYIILKVINFFVTPTFTGRITYTVAIVILFPMYVLYQNITTELKENKRIAKFIYIILMIQMTLGWFLTLLGYYSLGRSYFLSALDAFVLALILYVSIYTVIDYLLIMTLMFNKKISSFYINSDVVEKYARITGFGVAIIYFTTAYLKNMNFYDFAAAEVVGWFIEPRQLGGNIFTFNSILLFIISITGAIVLAGFINKVVETNDNKKFYKRRTSLGSFMLLIRFILIAIGFIVGVMASGIPLNQFTFLMGALGVGIGFGLQNIFNNMVSGLIIAIEKPISVGDMIEVGSDVGWVKGIGIRSSNIHMFNGAEIIVPNGDLISNKVTNWTLSDKQRRMEISVGVAYNSDPHQVYTIFEEVLKKHHEVMKHPEPTIYFTGLGNSSLDFNVFFWVSDFVEGKRIRSEVLFMIFDELKANNIEIPFPQHDLHLRSVSPDIILPNNNNPS